MNERLKELMTAAGTDSSGKWMGVEHAEKFAELIVSECVEVMKQNEMVPVGYIQPKSALIHSVSIKHHFGMNQ